MENTTKRQKLSSSTDSDSGRDSPAESNGMSAVPRVPLGSPAPNRASLTTLPPPPTPFPPASA
jgi:hypothetical protein